VFHTPSADDIPQPPAGFTLQATADDAGRPTNLYTKAVALGDSATWSMRTNNITTATSELHGYEVSGLDGSALVNATKIGTAGTYGAGANFTAGSMTTTTPDTLIIFACGLGGTSGGGTTVTTAWSSPQAGNDVHPRLLTSYRIMSAAATVSPSFGWTTARRANGFTVALKGGTTTGPAPDAYLAYVRKSDGTMQAHEIHSSWT
jgi:hypothetical protein